MQMIEKCNYTHCHDYQRVARHWRQVDKDFKDLLDKQTKYAVTAGGKSRKQKYELSLYEMRITDTTIGRSVNINREHIFSVSNQKTGVLINKRGPAA